MSAWISGLVRIETRLGSCAEAGFFIGQLGGVTFVVIPPAGLPDSAQKTA